MVCVVYHIYFAVFIVNEPGALTVVASSKGRRRNGESRCNSLKGLLYLAAGEAWKPLGSQGKWSGQQPCPDLSASYGSGSVCTLSRRTACNSAGSMPRAFRIV